MCFSRLGLLGLLVGLSWLRTLSARADGFSVSDVGVRPLARGGAFVAGADGPEALWYNPAGLARSENMLRLEAKATFMRASFERRAEGGAFAPVDMERSHRPAPLLGYVEDFGLEDFTFGLVAFSQDSQPLIWPGRQGDRPAAQRYAGLESDFLSMQLSLGMAWHGVEGLSLGIAPALILNRYESAQALSFCDGFVCSQPEDAAYDGILRVRRSLAATAGLSTGVTYRIGITTLGFALQAPLLSTAESELTVSAPSSALFEGASIGRGRAEVRLRAPAVLRFGVELAPVDSLRIELAGTYERWIRRQGVEVEGPAITVENAPGFGSYQTRRVQLGRRFEDSYSVRAGMEAHLHRVIGLRLGASYQSSSVAVRHLTPTHLDSARVTVAGGIALHIANKLDLDLTYGRVLFMDRSVEAAEAVALNASGADVLDAPPVANGDYSMVADVGGVALSMSL